MDAEKIGKAIQLLRNRAGYTQKELAERLVVTDKAVSRWERGKGIPDISLLRRLSIVLDTDIDSLLEGSVVVNEETWKGLIYVDYDPLTVIYDKPLFDYLVSYFLLVKIRDIVVFGQQDFLNSLNSHYNDGYGIGINLTYCTISLDEKLSFSIVKHHELFARSNVFMLMSSCVLYGTDLTRFLYRGLISTKTITSLCIVKNDPEHEIWIDNEKSVLSTETSSNVTTKYHYSLLPLLFIRGGINMIRDYTFSTFLELSKHLINGNMLFAELLDKGFVCFQINNAESVFETSAFIALVQKNTGTEVCRPEEIAFRRGLISQDELRRIAAEKENQYLYSLF